MLTIPRSVLVKRTINQKTCVLISDTSTVTLSDCCAINHCSRYEYGPWLDIIQHDLPNQPNVTTYAFEHYGRNVQKPEYTIAHVDVATLNRMAKGVPAKFLEYRECFFCWDPVEYVTHTPCNTCQVDHIWITCTFL